MTPTARASTHSAQLTPGALQKGGRRPRRRRVLIACGMALAVCAGLGGLAHAAKSGHPRHYGRHSGGHGVHRGAHHGSGRHYYGGGHHYRGGYRHSGHYSFGVHLGHYAYPVYGYPVYGYPVYGYAGWWPYAYGPAYGPPYAPAAVAAPAISAVDLEIKPSEAEIWVDGDLVGIADDFDGYPDVLSLPAGEHTIVIKHQGYKELTLRYDLRAGESLRVRRRMVRQDSTGP